MGETYVPYLDLVIPTEHSRFGPLMDRKLPILHLKTESHLFGLDLQKNNNPYSSRSATEATSERLGR